MYGRWEHTFDKLWEQACFCKIDWIPGARGLRLMVGSLWSIVFRRACAMTLFLWFWAK
ncbi:hypothetical protein PISMIDRAFT_685862 [Pisolithus microcarpus 441]|uniref:Uncharacterized protein n=1 Tax=Pisolithus microcarpus 441 TaxID=765257 RepID=A0A0C9Z366_9AGAM|nr:hypothetical protein PISMIDRAFT_685862 [Pisolithus microcarpus 441]